MNMPMQQNYYPPYNTRQSNGINWVQGIEGAKAFQLYPNSNIILLDSESDTFYIKTCDNVGMCNLRCFRYEEVPNTNKPNIENLDLSNFVTKDELKEILGGLTNGNATIQPIKPEQQLGNKPSNPINLTSSKGERNVTEGFVL